MPTETTLTPAHQSQIADWLRHGQMYVEIQLMAQQHFGYQPSIATSIELARTTLGDVAAVRRTRALDVARLLANDAAACIFHSAFSTRSFPIATGAPVKQIKLAIKRRLDAQDLALAQNRFTLQRTAQLRLEDEYRPKPPPPEQPWPDINRVLTPEEDAELRRHIARVLDSCH